MLNLSTGLKMAILGSAGFSLAMGGGIIRVFSGTRPASANDPVPVGVFELARITTMGRTFYPGNDTQNAGLFFRILPPGIIENNGSWGLVTVRSGVATWFRWNWWHVDNNDDETLSKPRIDGDVAVAGEIGDLYLPTRNLILGVDFNIDTFIASFGEV